MGAIIIPFFFCLLSLLVLGLLFPIYDFLQLRRKAKKKGAEPPNAYVLFMHIAKNQFLATFIGIVGLMLACAGVISFPTLDISTMTFIKWSVSPTCLGILMLLLARRMIR